MNPAQSFPTLRIISNATDNQHKNIKPLRYIEPQQGIMWVVVAPLFARNGWQLREQTALFLKAHHEKSEQVVIISKMGHGRVLIHHEGKNFGASHLHEIEDLAELQTLPANPIVKQSWLSGLMMGFRQFIS